MKKAWSFSEFFDVAIRNNIKNRTQRESVEMLLIGFDDRFHVTDTQASRYTKGGTINTKFVDLVESTSDEEIKQRVENNIGLIDIALSAEHIIDAFDSEEYEVSKVFREECKECYRKREYALLIAKAFKNSVLSPNQTTSGTFAKYNKEVHKEYGKTKTLFYTAKPRPVNDFYVCNSISPAPDMMISRRKAESDVRLCADTIAEPTLKKLQDKAKYVLLTGEAGLGKSMLMRHFLLEATADKGEKDTLAILVMLREYKGATDNLLALIINAVKALDSSISEDRIKEVLIQGKGQLLFDGVDEIPEKDTETFVNELNNFITDYPENQIVLSSRRYSSFVEMRKVAIYEVLPLSLKQAKRLIQKLDYYPDNPKLKKDFINRLENEYYNTHKDFASNPLLLTLMLMTAQEFPSLPSKKHYFYEEAYLTLLQKHDAKNKPGYKREFLSVDNTHEFTELFREFCAQSYRDSQFEFTKRSIEEYFQNLSAVVDLREYGASSAVSPQKLTFSHFLTDITKNANLMLEEGSKYLFLHRSFQEYFFADYYSRANDSALRRLGNRLRKSNRPSFNNNDALDMLYDMSAKKVERFIFLPYLADLFEHTNEQKKYRYFLTEIIGTLYYFVFRRKAIDAEIAQHPGINVDCPEMVHKLNDTKSTVLYWILKANGQSEEHLLIKDCYDEGICYKDLQRYPLFGVINEDETNGELTLDIGSNLNNTNGHGSSMYERDSLNHRIVFGTVCLFQMDYILNDPEKYQELIERLEAPDFPLREVYNWLKSYYQYLKRRYSNDDDQDDSF